LNHTGFGGARWVGTRARRSRQILSDGGALSNPPNSRSCRPSFHWSNLGLFALRFDAKSGRWQPSGCAV